MKFGLEGTDFIVEVLSEMKSCEKNWSLATAARAVLLTAAVRGDDDDGHGKLHSMLPLRNRICPTRPTKGLNRDLNFHFVF